MSRNPPSRPGIVFAVGARLEAQDYLQKWYTSRIEKIDYEEGKMLIHFERWSHRYDEWIYWDSHRLRPLEGQSLRKDALKDDEEITDFKTGDEVLARWTDCRYYPAKIEDINEEGTYTVQFYDGVIRSLKRMHIKSMPEDAKGQDWLALVKAATAAAAAAKNKTVGKPRVIKEKVGRKVGRGSHFKKGRVMSEVKEPVDEVHKKPEELASFAISGNSEPLTFEPKQTSGHAETSGARKRKTNVICSFQAKRARLNKITGLLASKAVSGDGSEMLEDGIGSHHVPDQLSPSYTTDQLKTEVSSEDSCTLNQKSDPFFSSPHSTKLRIQKTKPEEPSGNIEASDPSPPPTVPQGKELHNIEFPQTLPPPPPPSDIPQTDSDGYQLPRETNSFEISDLVPLDLSQHSRHKTSASVSSLQLPGKEQTMKPHSKVITDVSVASSSSVTNAKNAEDPLAPKEPIIELDHNKFKCRFPRCFKAFRKAKLLDYHIKYYHSTEKGSDSDTSTRESGMRSRANSTNVPPSIVDSLGLKSPRPLSSCSSSPPSNLLALQLEMPLDISHKPSKVCKKNRSSVSVSSEGTNNQPSAPVREKRMETVHERILKKCIDRDRNAEVGVKSERRMKCEEKNSSPGKKKEKCKEKKGKEHVKLKQKKKKKKKKRSKYELLDYEGLKDISLEFLERCSSPLAKSRSSLTLRCGSIVKPGYLSPKFLLSSGSLMELSTDHTPRHESLSDEEFFDGSSTESALLSEDYSQDLDISTNPDESQEEDENNATVRCVCGMDEENGFMIQCEECLCWQHSICLGLLEDSIPDQYICYLCQDPPGQRWNAKCCYDKEWLKNGHVYGLSFLKENYSQQNAKKIVSTHQLLADVYSVTEVLHGLQLKINILQSRKQPDLHLLVQSCKKSTQEQTTGEKLMECTDSIKQAESICHNQSHRERPSPSKRVEGTYITSEHSYQKPHGCSLEQNPTTDQNCSEDEDTNNLNYKTDQNSIFNGVERHTVQEMGILTGEGPTGTKETVTVSNERDCDGMAREGRVNSQFPWQLNLLTQIEAVQNEVNSRMDFIEKELNVLESWLDFSGELEPTEPLARLPQLKRHIKQLLTDLGKVEQMANCCSV
ncbi:PHD finger protein 20-like protein 1 isoform X2 [Stegostoma tigrinum]|uniref:PHD finger protein 20-like protein 1 isoform X2 n=1 Tax=Stegostoma tigrinum TaxID=3053191 RepID=UPI00202B6056|nr:PHD finger protein 20-like protein 1 isoform X2 [Stegostoma tigrinum]